MVPVEKRPVYMSSEEDNSGLDVEDMIEDDSVDVDQAHFLANLKLLVMILCLSTQLLGCTMRDFRMFGV